MVLSDYNTFTSCYLNPISIKVTSSWEQDIVSGATKNYIATLLYFQTHHLIAIIYLEKVLASQVLPRYATISTKLLEIRQNRITESKLKHFKSITFWFSEIRGTIHILQGWVTLSYPETTGIRSVEGDPESIFVALEKYHQTTFLQVFDFLQIRADISAIVTVAWQQ